MALPVLIPIISSISSALRIPALAVFLGQLLTTALGWLAVRMSRNLALNVAVLTMVVGLGVTTALFVKSVVTGISYVTPPYINQAFSYFIPDNAIYCISAIFSCRVAVWVMHWQYYAITKVLG